MADQQSDLEREILEWEARIKSAIAAAVRAIVDFIRAHLADIAAWLTIFSSLGACSSGVWSKPPLQLHLVYAFAFASVCTGFPLVLMSLRWRLIRKFWTKTAAVWLAIFAAPVVVVAQILASRAIEGTVFIDPDKLPNAQRFLTLAFTLSFYIVGILALLLVALFLITLYNQLLALFWPRRQTLRVAQFLASLFLVWILSLFSNWYMPDNYCILNFFETAAIYAQFVPNVRSATSSQGPKVAICSNLPADSLITFLSSDKPSIEVIEARIRTPGTDGKNLFLWLQTSL